MTLHAKLSDTASINDEVRLQLSGAFDADGVTAQRSTLEALADSPARRVVLDLSDVLSMDGSGIGALSFLFKRLTARRRKLVLNGVAGQPLAMIGELGLLRTLGIADSAIRVTTRRRWFGGLAVAGSH